jgi:hypothetical protein
MVVRKGPTTAKRRGSNGGEVADEALGCDGEGMQCSVLVTK